MFNIVYSFASRAKLMFVFVSKGKDGDQLRGIRAANRRLLFSLH